jgi:1-acyl-sn-glycerol-3-phosphate acyltransferase
MTSAEGRDPGPLPEDTTVWRGHRETGLVGRPTRRAGWAYRLARFVLWLLLKGILRFRIEVEGREHLPVQPRPRSTGGDAKGWIAAGVPHRTWVDPFVIMLALPIEPRLVFFGDGRAMFRSWWRRLVVGLVGGLIPIWVRRYTPGVEREDVMATYTTAVRSAIAAGAVLAIMPETGPPVPPERARPFGRGLAYFALRADAPIVPIILGGTDVLFLGRRIVVRILPPVTPADLLGGDAIRPVEGSREERLAARRITAALEALTASHVPEVRERAAPAPGAKRRWIGLTHLWR